MYSECYYQLRAFHLISICPLFASPLNKDRFFMSKIVSVLFIWIFFKNLFIVLKDWWFKPLTPNLMKKIKKMKISIYDYSVKSIIQY